MKKALIIVPVLAILAFVAVKVFASSDSEEGIKFYRGNWEAVVQKAKAEHKPIFLDIYASWCGPCKMLKRKTFTNDKVGEYFNSHFVNTSFDGEVEDGVMLAEKFHIQGYPTLILIDENGKVIMYEMGYQTPKELIGLVKHAVGE